MKFLYVDFETRMDKELRLSKMTTRRYCEQTDVTMAAWALDDEEIQYHVGTPSAELLETFRVLCARDDVTVVAFNASFDVRVLAITLGLPYPRHFTCALELARCAWPNQPGGYSLDNLAVQLGLAYQKIKIDLETAHGEELATYCKMDVAILRELHKRELFLVSPEEQRVCELSNRAKTIVFSVDQTRVLQAVENMSKLSGEHALAVARAFDDDPEILKAFGWYSDHPPESVEAAAKMVPKSVKPHKIKDLLLDRLCIDFVTSKKSISIKKMNMAELSAMPAQAQKLIIGSSDLNKAISYRRGLAKFSGLDHVDCELSYAAAHTLRFASRNEGSKGLNLHNLPKHNKLIAEPFRRSFVLPEGYVWVRGDFANVEYRVEGLLTGCDYVREMFEANPFADPYGLFCEWATGIKLEYGPEGKMTPASKALRQLFKAAVLGLGYMMGLRTWMTQLLQVVARKDASIDDFIKLAGEKHWSSMSRWAKSQVKRLGCHEVIGIVGEHVHELFHQRHPEFAKFGRWIENAVARLSWSHAPEAVLDELYNAPGAPDRKLLDLSVDRSLGGSSVRAATNWPASVCWRDLAIRETLRGACLTSVLAGHKPPRAVTPNILIENVVQHLARNALVKGQLALEAMGHERQLSIHDEVFILAPATAEGIMAARRDMLRVFGPSGSVGFDWAILIDPKAVTVSRSLWDDEDWCKKTFWPRLESGDESVIAEIA